ncbi:MAG: hypothetical protein ABI939_09305 [Anaerolineaceae bacterium]
MRWAEPLSVAWPFTDYSPRGPEGLVASTKVDELVAICVPP